MEGREWDWSNARDDWVSCWLMVKMARSHVPSIKFVEQYNRPLLIWWTAALSCLSLCLPFFLTTSISIPLSIPFSLSLSFLPHSLYLSLSLPYFFLYLSHFWMIMVIAWKPNIFLPFIQLFQWSWAQCSLHWISVVGIIGQNFQILLYVMQVADHWSCLLHKISFPLHSSLVSFLNVISVVFLVNMLIRCWSKEMSFLEI